jgi:CO/xanthine dehydrogenase FAD-binding subunit
VSICYRRLPKFDYVKPKGVVEALDLLGENKDGRFMVYAGGTDVIPKIKSRMIRVPEMLMDLKGIPDLDYISYDVQCGLRIGALANIYAVANSPLVKKNYQMLSQAASSIASTQVQNRGTIVGNICNAVPSADSAPALLCLDAKVLCVGSKRKRLIDVEAFFEGPNKTVLASDELVKEIQIPPLQGHGIYIKLSHRSRMDLAVVGVAVYANIRNGIFEDIRVALGAVAPTPLRAKKTEAILMGERASDEGIKRAAATASKEAKPIDDYRASAGYRRMMVEVLVERAIHQVISN